MSSYTTKSATLTLKHNHPPRQVGQAEKPIKVQVDVRLLLTTMKAKETQVGEWVNVIGYITANPNTTPKGDKLSEGASDLQVQALILWSAGSFDLHGYEQSLDHQRKDRESSAKKFANDLQANQT